MKVELINALQSRFGAEPETDPRDPVPSFWLPPEQLLKALHYLKREAEPWFEMLFDLSAIDEAGRHGGYTVFYQLLSLSGNIDLRLKVVVPDDSVVLPSVTSIWPAANWYEREVYDLFGLRFDGHPDLRRILMPEYWEGHPLRKDYPGRATEMEPYSLPPERYRTIMETYRARDSQSLGAAEGELILNIGPNHPGTHGLLRLIVRLQGEKIRTIEPDIGYHHRGAEKIAEFHTYHNYIPYTDRVDYLAGILGELPYVLALEQLTGIKVPPRAQVMRVLLAEIFRISSHLVWLGSYGHDVGSMAPAFYCFREREHLFDVVELITGGRMHPEFLRIGGVAQDLPEGWKDAVKSLTARIEHALPEYERLLTRNPIFLGRTRGIGVIDLNQALEWGFTGPNLRACGLAWDLRKNRPYSGYEEYDFEVPTATEGDCLARTEVRIREMRESVKIIRQAATRMPDGPVLSADARYAFPRKEATLQDIETLIHHFIAVSHGMGFPAGESWFAVETSKGMTGYYVISDGSTHPYRLRIRTPSFPHIQALSRLTEGHLLSDLISILGSIDYVLADVDR